MLRLNNIGNIFLSIKFYFTMTENVCHWRAKKKKNSFWVRGNNLCMVRFLLFLRNKNIFFNTRIIAYLTRIVAYFYLLDNYAIILCPRLTIEKLRKGYESHSLCMYVWWMKEMSLYLSRSWMSHMLIWCQCKFNLAYARTSLCEIVSLKFSELFARFQQIKYSLDYIYSGPKLYDVTKNTI